MFLSDAAMSAGKTPHPTPLLHQEQLRTAATVWGLGAWSRPGAHGLSLSGQLAGRLTELSGELGQGGTSWVASLIRAAQRASEYVAWVQVTGGSLYPPDMSDAGVDLEELLVVQTPKTGPEGVIQQLRAAELLLRSGGVGLLILDWLDLPAPRQIAWQGRLLALARQYQSAVVLLTNRHTHQESLGPLVQWRLQSQQTYGGPGERHLSMQVLKHKGQAPQWPWQLRRRGPTGLIL